MAEKHIHHTADGPDSLPDALRMNPYTVPDGYFERLSPHLLRRCDAMVDPTGSLPIPSAYFEQMEASIHGKVAEQKLKALVAEPGFAVPDGYFDSLSQRSVAEAALRERVSETGYWVPEMYFGDLQTAIAYRTRPTGEDQAPVRRLHTSSWLPYAAAACLALLLTTWNFLGRFAENQAVDSSLAMVPEQEIYNYLELYGSAADMAFISEQLTDVGERNIGNGLSEADIEAYLNHTL